MFRLQSKYFPSCRDPRDQKRGSDKCFFLRAWVRHRIEEVIGQLSTVLDEDQIDDTVQAFKRKRLDLATRCTRSSPTKKGKKVPVQPRRRASSSHQSHQDACSPIYSQSRALCVLQRSQIWLSVSRLCWLIPLLGSNGHHHQAARQQRRNEALQLIADGVSPTYTAMQLSQTWGCSRADRLGTVD